MDQNISFCLKSASHFGSNTYHNVCNGTTTVVPWGSVDWVMNIGAMAIFASLLVVVAVSMGAATYAGYKMYKEGIY